MRSKYAKFITEYNFELILDREVKCLQSFKQI